MKWCNKSSNYIKYQELVDNMDNIIDGKISDKPTLSTIENHVIILPTDTKIEPIVEEYIYRSQYFVMFYYLSTIPITCTFLTATMTSENRYVSSYMKCTNHMTSFGAINHHYLNTCEAIFQNPSITIKRGK